MTILQRITRGPSPIYASAPALLMTLTACGGSDAPTSPSTSEATAAPAADETPLGPPPGSVATDREILIAVYNALDGPNWEARENWLSDAPLGEWSGVTTDDNGRVILLQLGASGSEQALRGEIPPELGGLGALTLLGLHGLESREGVPLGGEIPPELGNLVYLEYLSLTWSELSGQIPPELGNYETLVSLDLSENQLSGDIPSELGNLDNLRSLGLHENQLSGEIPSEVWNMLEREVEIEIHGNQFPCLTGGLATYISNSGPTVESQVCHFSRFRLEEWGAPIAT